MKIIRIRVNKSIPGYAAGTVSRAHADDKGIPVDKFWRDRLRDAKTDSCVEIVLEKVASKQAKKPTKDTEKS